MIHPRPCAHCANNFMRKTSDVEEVLCNCCLIKEEIRNPKEPKQMDHIDILISCPREIQIEIEEYCINSGTDFSKYFLSLHYLFKEKTDAYSECQLPEIKPDEKKIRAIKKSESKTDLKVEL